MSGFSRFFNKSAVLLSRIFFVIVLLFLFIVFPVSAANVERVSVSSASVEGDASSVRATVSSAVGRYVVFESSATNLVLGDGNGVEDIFVHDRDSNTTERVSVDSLGVEGDGVSSFPSISSDGRYVAFQSVATNLVAGDTNASTDIFVHDRDSNTTERVSVDSLGVEGDGNSIDPSISSDGRYVAFQSVATNLVAGDGNGVSDIFVFDRQTDTIERVSIDDSGLVVTDGDSSTPSISGNGQYVSFLSDATNLVSGDTNGAGDIFVYNRTLDTIERVSVDSSGIEADSNSSNPSLSTDGNLVVFASTASNLVDGSVTGGTNIFVHNRDSNITEIINVDSLEGGANNFSQSPHISADGRYVAFISHATNLVSGDTNGAADIFVRDRTLGLTERVSVNNSGTEGNGVSFTPSISSGGRYVSFHSGASNLAASDTNFSLDAFVFDRNDVPTDITLSNSTIDENDNSGTVVGTLSTTDADMADTHTYSIACTVPGVDDSSFDVSGSNLVSGDSFDYETKSSYTVCIRTDDGNDGTYDESFTISIIDVRESTGGSGGDGGPTGDPGDDERSEEESDPIDPPPPPPIDPIDPPPPQEEPPVEPTPEEQPDPLEEPDSVPEDPSDDFPSDNPSANNDPSTERDFPVFENIKESVAGITIETVEFIENIPEQVKDTAVVAGLAVPAIVAVVTQPAVVVNVLSVPARLWNLIPIWLGFRRKKRPWGTVYDSVTKQPLDPVYIELRDKSGKSIATTITDIDGRFGFLVPPGKYNLSLKKDGYTFPSAKLSDKPSDELYGNIYRGEEVEITGADDLLINNIPMDSVNFNWNEFEKSNNRKLMRFYSKRDVFLAKIAGISFWGGFIFSLVFLFIGSGTLNYIILGIYAFVFLLRLLGVRPKKPGYVTERETGFPLSFGLVKVFSASLRREIAHAVISKTGKYYILVPKGEYYLSIEKKTGENSYEEVYISSAFKTSKGFIGRNFKI